MLMAIFPIRYVFPSLPFGQGALVHTQDLAAFNGRNLQIETSLLDPLTDMPGMSRIPVGFPQVAVVLAAARLPLGKLSVVSFKAYFNSIIGAYRKPHL
jgi:hypothetical protein